MIDKVKLGIAALILGGGVYGYYELPALMGQDVSVLLRAGLLIVAVVVALGVAATSQYGASLIEFSKGSRIELRKMVWPTRQETIQTTLIVLLLVVLVAVFLWLIDMAVFEVIYDWLLGVED
jgi:preprotein translocase subunit SecE